MAKEKGKGKIKQFFEEFKKFITRGNVLDMSVGVIVGGAFTGIVNGLSNYILKPLINWLLSLVLRGEGLEGAITILSPTYVDGVIDLANSIYIDWGAFISAIINFLLIAIVLFSIVKIMNSIAEAKEKMDAESLASFNKKKAIKAIQKAQKVSKKEAKMIWQAERDAEALQKAEEARLAESKAAEEKALAEAKAMANTRLLEEIRDLLKQK